MAEIEPPGDDTCPPLWLTRQMASLKALCNDLNPPQVSAQLSLEF
jgi:hypothetical protein